MIHEYNYKPEPIIILSKDEDDRAKKCGKNIVQSIASMERANRNRLSSLPICIGMELEIELVKTDRQRLASDFSNSYLRTANELFLYFKKDSSLVNGFEIVSHPRSIASWVSIKNKLKDFMGAMRKDGFRSYDTGRCGMHFHINRSAFSGKLHVAKFMRFWQENHELSFALSRRSETSMAKYAHFQPHKAEILASLIYDFGYGGGGMMGNINSIPKVNLAHHSAVALTPNTVEIRIFRGTMNVSTIIATMEMVAKVLTVTRDCGASSLTVKELLKFIPDNKKNKKTIKMLSMSKPVKLERIVQEDGNGNHQSRYKAKRDITFGAIAGLMKQTKEKGNPIAYWIGLANKSEIENMKYRLARRAESKKKKKADTFWYTEREEDRMYIWHDAIRDADGIIITFNNGLSPTTEDQVNTIARRNILIGRNAARVDTWRRRQIVALTGGGTQATQRAQILPRFLQDMNDMTWNVEMPATATTTQVRNN